MLLAVERNQNDGPWTRPDDYRRWNAVVGVSRGDLQNGFAVNALLYEGTWDATDQAPRRAVDSAGSIMPGSIAKPAARPRATVSRPIGSGRAVTR